MKSTKNTTNSFLFFLFLLFLFFCLSFGFLAKPALAKSAKRAVGWHWYNEVQPAKHLKKKQKQKEKKNKPISAVTQMNTLRKMVREAKARAILYPTEANVYQYLRLQNFVTQKAVLFSRMWQKTLLDAPALDYGVLHPTENNAQQVIYAEESAKEKQAIANFRNQYGLFFFYRGNNLLDQKLAPTIVAFSQKNQIALIPISIDGRTLNVFPNSKVDQGQAAKLGIRYFPALILVNAKEKKIKPLNYGFIAGDELKRRFLQVATSFQEGV